MADDFQVFFVNPPTDQENNSVLTKAFQAVKDSNPNFKPQWLSQEDCLKLGKEKGVYICEPFSGPAFEHLQSVENRIYGPQCILSCLLHEMELPKRVKKPRAIYNLAMRNVKLCCTSIDKVVREDIQSKVLLMSGEVEASLTKDTTHLIAGEVGSNKYNVAYDHGIKVMTADWVLKVWEASLKPGHILAQDEQFEKYRCPPFLGLTVVVSGYHSAERNTLKNFVLRGGGNYSGEMKMNECTHLITKKPEGAKYEAAKTWKIKIVEDKWLTECMDKKRYVDPTPFLIEKRESHKTSTPERRSIAGPNISDVSSIMGEGEGVHHSTFAQIDETTDLSITRHGNQSTRTVAETHLWDDSSMSAGEMTMPPQGQCDLFLDGCKIYFSGVRPALEDKLKKIVISGGGLSAPELTDTVTHIIVAEMVPKDIGIVKRMEELPSIVNTDWLMDCFRQRSRLEEKQYRSMNFEDSVKGSTKSKSRRDVPNLPGPSAANTDGEETLKSARHDQSNSATQDTQKEAASDMDMAGLLSQYMEEDGQQNEPPVPMETEHQAADTTESQEATVLEGHDEEMFFTTKTFTILGFDEEETAELAKLIESKGGKVVPGAGSKQRRVIDLAVVPLLGCPVTVTVSEVLTNGWMQMCIEADRFLGYDDGWMFRPLELPSNEPLTDCCISVSGHVGVERECIVHLAVSLGAVCQDHLARKPTKDMKANTHLIVSESTGKKYNAARKWNLHTVGKEWLLACMASGKREPEEDFDIVKIEQKREEEDVDQTMENEDQTMDPGMNNKSNASEQSKAQSENSSTNEVSHNLPELEESHKSPALTSPRARSPHVPTSSTESNTADKLAEALENPMARIRLASKTGMTPTLSNELNRSRTSTPRSVCKPNQTENISASKTPTAGTPTDLRRQVLKSSAPGSADIPPGTPRGLVRGGLDATPGTFLQPGYKVKWNFEGCFDSPEPPEEDDLNKSTPLMETFRRGIKKFVENTSKPDDNEADMMCSQGTSAAPPPLQGVVIAVAKKLGRNHEEYNTLVVELGGDFSWSMGANVTHFVFEGRGERFARDKELKQAKEDGKLVVSPHWLFACKEQNVRVDESLYPYNFNPNQCLAMTPSSRGGGATPRSTRARAAARPESQRPQSPAPKILQTPNSPASAHKKAPTAPSPAPKKAPVLNLMESAGSSAAKKETVQSPRVVRVKEKPAVVSNANGRSSPLPQRRTGTRSRRIEENNLDKEEKEDQPVMLQQRDASPLPNNINETAETTVTTDSSIANERETTTSASDSDHDKNKEAKKLLTETLGNVLADSSRSNRATRRKGRLNLSGQLSASENDLSGKSPWSTKEKKTSRDTTLSDPPQSVQVTWDDPTGRLEEERLAHRLAHVCDPSQQTQTQSNNTEDMMMAAMEMDMTETRTKIRSPTPEPPSLAFPRPKSRVMTPQPVELLSEEDSSDTLPGPPRAPPAFLMSGLSNEEKINYSALIESLGGRTLEKQNFDPNCTHLIIAQPARNEKFLACIASGKWVLHKSYLEACRKEGRFVPEENHEWGSSFTLPLLQNMTATANKLAQAAHKWRSRVEATRGRSGASTGAFHEWRVLLCLPSSKEENFSRLLAAGGATVTSVRPPFDSQVSGTHAFIDLNKVPIPAEQLTKLIVNNIHCLKPEFIPATLTDDPTPDPSEFYPAEVVAIKADLPEATKRKRQGSNDSSRLSSKVQRR